MIARDIMSTPNPIKTPVHFVRACVAEALKCALYGDAAEALTLLQSATCEADTAIVRIADGFAPASLVLTAARHGAGCAHRALIEGHSSEAIGALRATLAALNNVPHIIEAHAD